MPVAIPEDPVRRQCRSGSRINLDAVAAVEGDKVAGGVWRRMTADLVVRGANGDAGEAVRDGRCSAGIRPDQVAHKQWSASRPLIATHAISPRCRR